MTTPNLPRADQPDTYTGCYPGTPPRIATDTTNPALIHMMVAIPGASQIPGGSPHTAGTYCGAMPGAPMEFVSKQVRTRISLVLHLARTSMRDGGKDMWLCPHCCTALAVETEMNGQNAYKTKTLVNQLRALEREDNSHPRGKRHA